MRKVFYKYRIMPDQFAGFQVEKWRIWFPFWIQSPWPVNTFMTYEQAETFIQNQLNKKTY